MSSRSVAANKLFGGGVIGGFGVKFVLARFSALIMKVGLSSGFCGVEGLCDVAELSELLILLFVVGRTCRRLGRNILCACLRADRAAFEVVDLMPRL